MRYDKGVEQHLFETLSARIQEITEIFGTIPDYIVDEWVKDMLADKQWDDRRITNLIANRKENPFTLKETEESVVEDWDNVEEILNRMKALEVLHYGW